MNIRILATLLLVGLSLCAMPKAQAQAPMFGYCIKATSTECNSPTVNPGTGSQGDQLFQFGYKYNFNFHFLSPMFALPANSLPCNSTGSANALTTCSLTTYLSLPTDPTAIACGDIVALWSLVSGAGSGLTSVTPCQIGLFVGTASQASGASMTPSCAVEDNFSTNTAGAGTYTVNAPTGCTPAEGQKLLLHIKFTNAQTYSWNAAFVGGTVALPTTSTGTSKGDWISFRYDSINAKWDYLAAAVGF